MSEMLQHDVVAWLISVGVAAFLLKIHTFAVQLKVLSQGRVRKGLHITTGLVYVATWTLFSDAPHARYLAVITPVVHTLRTVAVYLGLYRSQALLDIMTRSGRMEEMSQGPIWYGLVLIAATLACWRERPAGVAAVAVMCAGDGLAELVGQALGGPRWPHNRRKTVAGSCALAAFGFATAFGYAQWFCHQGYYPCPANAATAAVVLGAAASLAAAVESLPIEHIINDNLSVPLTVAAVVHASNLGR